MGIAFLWEHPPQDPSHREKNGARAEDRESGSSEGLLGRDLIYSRGMLDM
jgi:hypothetical protein